MFNRVINMRGRGLRGESFSSIARRTGAYGAQSTDSDLSVLERFANWAISANPFIKGDKGDPGGNVMSIGTLRNASSLNIPVGTDLVQLSGNQSAGDEGTGTVYVYDSNVTMEYATSNPYTSFISSNGRGFRLVISLISLSSEIEKIREVLHRPYRHRSPIQREAQIMARSTVTACRHITTNENDGLPNVAGWWPGAGGNYPFFWTRDQSMGMGDYPDAYPSNEIDGQYRWLKTKVRQHPTIPSLGLEVPDHTAGTGFAYYHPGGDDADPGSGNRAPVDGNFFLLQMRWVYFYKTNDISFWNEEAQFLWNLIEQIPYDSNTNCVYVSPNDDEWYLPWGFMDAVRVSGSVAMATVLAYRAYLQYADMAFASGDITRAKTALIRSEQIKNGLNNTLAVTISNSANFTAMYRTSTGICSGQYDVWASALACYLDIPTREIAIGVSNTLANAWGAFVTIGGVKRPELYYRGGIRHVLRSNDFEPNAKSFEGGRYDVIGYDTYQLGGYWNTPVHWVAYSVGLTSPAVASKIAHNAITEMQYETWAYLPASNPSPLEWVGIGGNPSPDVYSDDLLGAVNYMTSATAMVAVSANDVGDLLNGKSSYIPDESFDDTPIPVGWSVVQMRAVATDELQACNRTGPNFVVPFAGRYRVRMRIRFGDQTAAPGEILGAFALNGVRSANVFNLRITDAGSFSVTGEAEIDALPGDQIDARIYTTFNNLTPKVVNESGTPEITYNSVEIEFVGNLALKYA